MSMGIHTNMVIHMNIPIRMRNMAKANTTVPRAIPMIMESKGTALPPIPKPPRDKDTWAVVIARTAQARKVNYRRTRRP